MSKKLIYHIKYGQAIFPIQNNQQKISHRRKHTGMKGSINDRKRLSVHLLLHLERSKNVRIKGI